MGRVFKTGERKECDNCAIDVKSERGIIREAERLRRDYHCECNFALITLF